jgi:hypothetical protein
VVAKSSEQIVRCSCVSLRFHSSFASLYLDIPVLNDQQDLTFSGLHSLRSMRIMHMTL